MSDDMNTRLLHAEWEIEALKEGHRKQGDRIADMALRMEAHHKEVMNGISELKDERARQEGAAAARVMDAQARQTRIKWLSLGLTAIGTLIALGLIGEAKALPVDTVPHDAPIPVQHHTRVVP